ncbi:T9SS type A sorting domain-containing protein [Dysgonomonas gadei]|uniref:DUF11 domain-containing protein n=1 Tax=Dysgonomonas gadei ATCC BAA-286 TaxID=742766 RepID=F5ITL7_9BACT|nr:T9SS type A sorting domain-containing protein [Dysgonomonas gadei]EGJ99401.1 hypothetical protein HMPREF9455_00434 [Dysgonomonas gadei ATCC BAA-286]
MNYISNRFLFFILLFISLLPLVGIYADGSKDLYPSGTTGNRAYLRSNTGVTENWPFPNRGTHFVYAEVGETITLASSAQSGTTKRIRLYAPNGNEVTLTVANNQGNIADRNAELAGPRRVGQAAGDNRYLPIYYTVPAGAAGIYKVEFDGTGNNSGSVTGAATSLSQPSNSSYVAGWDVSVINTTNTDFIKGRVYTNVLNMSVASSTTTGFYGLVYVLTKDGYTYRVNNNGNNGIYFTFFVNNNGFVNATTKVPIYKSLNTTTGIGNQVHDPNLADTDVSITHKLFYTQPSADLPLDVEVSGAVPGGKTWLKNTIVVPKVEEVKVLGTDNTEGQISSKGGYIRFKTESQGTFTIKIESTGTPAFTTRHMYGAAKIGENSVYWDGKDGDNIPIPAGHVPAKITVQLQGAEVHFPFFDMEMNLRGTIIELLDHNNLNNVLSDIVYWDDSNITINSNNNSGSSSSPVNNSHLPPTNSSGISSNSNGHKWAVGISNASNGFGNEKSIDTWTFIKGEEKTIETAVTIKEADLQVSSVTVDKTSVRLEEEDINGDYNPTILSYTVKVKNNGPSDVVGAPFTFTLPKGFDGTGYTAVFNSNGCGTESVVIVYDAVKRQYSSSLNLPDGCEITYTFQAKVTLDADPGNNNAVATILRPNDVTDPDATNTSDPANPVAPANAENPYDLTLWYVLPTDPYFECANNGKGGNCNNIKGVMVNLTRETDLAIEKTVNESNPEVSDFVTFTLKITNHGPHSASNIIIEDILPNGYTLGSINNGGTSAGNTITWNITSLAKEANISVSFTAKVNASGSYLNTASVSGDGVDPEPDNNTDTETVVPCREENIFFEDFGVSAFPEASNNFGRLTSPYMPSNSFKFGTPYPLSEEYDKYAIDNNHYAIVAPGYIKMGHKSNDYYFWTPPYNESNTVQDRSGTEDGAVMVVNAGQVLNSFYKRPQLLQVGASYRASLWLYLVNGPSQVAIDILNPKTNEVLATIESHVMNDWDTSVKNKWTYLELYFSVPVPDDEENCKVDNIIISFRNNLAENNGNDYYIDDISLDKVCSVPNGTIIIRCPDPNYKRNYWHGTVSNEWADTDNWTAEFVPATGEDIEFATDINNGSSGNGNGLGTSVRDLHLDTDRVIGDLINNSDMDLLVTTENQLTINGVVRDDNPAKGTIVVKASTDKPTGTLFFADPDNNRNVNATVEFYNKAYECSTCGFYKNQWQYFGIPVQASGFPYLTPKVETINQWVEPFSGNKWQPAPYTPDTGLKAFKGYEMTNSSNTLPTHIYSFPGILNVGNAVVPLTRTSNVNYSGMNLVGNSFTAAIPITTTAIELGSVELTENTVYLFNMGTRDQWRKLNGGTVSGVAGGQYQAVPFNLAGQVGIPDRILSMHTFMLDVKTPGSITLKYGELIKNELNTSTTKPWKSAYTESRTPQYPYIVMDVVSNTSADRVWLFENSNTTKGFDNGWDAYKLQEEGLTQVYVSDETESKYQIATVPEFTGTTFGVHTIKDEKFSITLSVTSDVEMRKLYLHDIHTGRSYPIGNNVEYTFSGTNTITNGRFKITESSSPLTGTGQESSLVNVYVRNNQVVVDNQSEKNCVATVYDILGRLLDEKKVFSNSSGYFVGSQLINKGIYIVKIVSEDKSINKSERVLLK